MSRELMALLGRLPLFHSLPEDYRKLLAERAEGRTYGEGEVVYRKGDLGEHAFIILKGQVALLDEDDVTHYTAELGRRRAGEPVGMTSLVSGLPRTATCRALEPTLAMALDQRLVFGLAERVPKFSIELCRFLATQGNRASRRKAPAPAGTVTHVKYDPEVYNLIPSRILEQHRMIPVELTETALTVATPDPENIAALDDLQRFLHGIEIRPVFLRDIDYRRFMRRHFKDARLPQRSAQPSGPRGSAGWRAVTSGSYAAKIEYIYQKEETSTVTGADPVAELDEIIGEALELHASDIHIEPTRDGVVVRYRVDGVLQERPKSIARNLLRALVARVKVVAGVNISEYRLPQDGRFSFSLGEHLYDMRVSTMPTIVGEKVVMRILDTARASRPLEDLFIVDRWCRLVKRLVHRPFGMLITTGPTGSGKTTTLYASLHERRATRVNITTVEDPVEYYVPGVNQVQVNEVIGLDFPMVLRGILRQNPDIILVGEMRDAATARISLEAGLTGHLVLTSLHANTSTGALLRLLEMGMDPFTIGHAVNGIVNQRLVRQICPNCRAPHVYRPAIVDLLVKGRVFARGFDGSLFRGRGCDECAGTGLKGRIALFEVLSVTEAIRAIIGRQTTIDDLDEAAKKGGFLSLQQYAAQVLLEGLTTPEEVFRVTGSPGQE